MCITQFIGEHPMLLIGSPGIGKTMLNEQMKSLIPPITHDQAIENTCIQSFNNTRFEFTNTPPFRSPHHSISYAGMLGGKNPPQPGEITMSNHGILFLDELGEYNRTILDTLREPMETHSIQLSRAGHSVQYPAKFLLIAAMNPCYCGYYFDPNHGCSCSPSKIKQYWQKISQPLLDRISICCILSKPNKHHASISHDELLNLITTGKKVASNRNPNGCSNHDLSHKELMNIAKLNNESKTTLDSFFESHHVSLRGQVRLTKLSRTIADAYDSTSIKKNHVLHAIQLTQHQQLPN
jgi:Predicted ATPase with chaperone activity